MTPDGSTPVPDSPGLITRGIFHRLAQTPSGLTIGYSTDAGWSSLVARRAHNPKVAGSNPAPATENPRDTTPGGFLWPFSLS